MSDPNNPNISQRSTPQWGLYQRELFWGPNEGKHPPFNTRKTLYPYYLLVNSLTPVADPDKLRETAKERLSQSGW